MLQGARIAGRIRLWTSLDDLTLIVRQITRHAPHGTTDEQPPRLQGTDIYFEVDEQDAEDLALELARCPPCRAPARGHPSDTETFVGTG